MKIFNQDLVKFKNVVIKYPTQSSSVMIGIYQVYINWDGDFN